MNHRTLVPALTSLSLVFASTASAAPPEVSPAAPAEEHVGTDTPAQDPDHSPTDRADRDREDREARRSIGWIAVGLGGSAAVIALGTGAYMLHDLSVRNGGCDASKQCTPDGAAANSELSQLAPWNLGTFIVAAVGLGAGAFLVLTNPATPNERDLGAAKPSPTYAVGLAPTPSGGAFSLRGTF